MLPSDNGAGTTARANTWGINQVSSPRLLVGLLVGLVLLGMLVVLNGNPIHPSAPPMPLPIDTATPTPSTTTATTQWVTITASSVITYWSGELPAHDRVVLFCAGGWAACHSVVARIQTILQETAEAHPVGDYSYQVQKVFFLPEPGPKVPQQVILLGGSKTPALLLQNELGGGAVLPDAGQVKDLVPWLAAAITAQPIYDIQPLPSSSPTTSQS